MISIEALYTSSDNIAKITIPNGIGDVRKFFNNKLLIATTSFVTDDVKLPIPTPEGDHYLNRASLILTGDDGASVILKYFDNKFKEYLKDIELLTGKFIEVGEDKIMKYPEGSVEYQLGEFLKIEKNLEKTQQFFEINNKNSAILLSTFATVASQKTAKLLGVETLNTPETTIMANSKNWLRENAHEGGYKIPNGFEMTSIQQLDEFHNFISDKSLKIVWIKFDSLSGGDGVWKYEIGKDSLSEILSEIFKTAILCDFLTENDNKLSEKEKFEKILKVVPIVVEQDIESKQDTEYIIANYNIQGVICNKGVRIIGGASGQQTDENGNYLGNKLPLSKTEASSEIYAIETFFKTALQARKDGYRGVAGGDVMVRKTKSGKIEGIIFDFNGRKNASTPFLRIVHFLEQKYKNTLQGKPLYALNVNLTFNKGIDFECFLNILGNHLVYTKDSINPYGVIPTAFKSLNKHNLDPVVKVTVVAPSEKEFKNLIEKIKDKGVKFG